jgi:hypothetical protein
MGPPLYMRCVVDRNVVMRRLTVFLNTKTRGVIFYNVTRFGDCFGETQALLVGSVDCLTFTNAAAVWLKITFMEWRLDTISIVISVCIQILILFAVSLFLKQFPYHCTVCVVIVLSQYRPSCCLQFVTNLVSVC